MKVLQCFQKSEHQSHQWEFLYDRPITEYTCPGVSKAKDEDND